MEIKRKFELTERTYRRYIIRPPASEKQISCTKCGGTMLTTGQAAGIVSINQRRIFQIIETEAVHYTEIDVDAVMICITSLADYLDEFRQNDLTGKTDLQHSIKN